MASQPVSREVACHPFCPNCGADIRADSPVFVDGWTMIADGYPVSYQGKVIRLTPSESALCWTLIKAYPMAVKLDTLLMRMDSDGYSNVFHVLLSRIRTKFRERGVPNPIETMSGKMYRWKGAQDVAADEAVRAAGYQ